MSTDAGSVELVIDLMNKLVARDGGHVTLNSYDASAKVLEVEYTFEPNEDCLTCTISADMLQTFLAESLRTHGIQIGDLIVIQR